MECSSPREGPTHNRLIMFKLFSSIKDRSISFLMSVEIISTLTRLVVCSAESPGVGQRASSTN